MDYITHMFTIFQLIHEIYTEKSEFFFLAFKFVTVKVIVSKYFQNISRGQVVSKYRHKSIFQQKVQSIFDKQRDSL